MATTQYIGARYVPVFADPAEWTSERTYEPLTIVLHEGNSYTSRQYVPAGIDITNARFWCETGNYNAQVEAYRREVLAFDGRITTNTEAIAAETEAREEAIAAINGLFPIQLESMGSDSVGSAQLVDAGVTTAKLADDSVTADKLADDSVTADALNDDLLRRYWARRISTAGTHMVVFGDSYSAPEIANSLDAYWPKRVAGALGLTLHNFAIAGAGFGRTGQLISRQQEICQTTMTADEAADTSVVICYAGCNDLLNDVAASAINSGVVGFITWANGFFPYADIYVIPYNWGFSKLTQARNNMITNTMNSYMSYNRDRVHIIPYAWCWNLGIASRYQNEVHPNTGGYNQIAAQILNAIAGGPCYASGTGNTLNVQNASGLDAGFINYNFRNGLLELNGYLRPSAAGASNVTIYAAGNGPAILTPNDSLFVLPLIDATKHIIGGNFTINSDGRIVANFNAEVGANDVCCFNGTFMPEVGVNWSAYV